ncbi:22166_t:CDS:2 [Entrophospora sp. SA101]|nr:15182_t:CDS:2 [Entrophospora sp. SA101]CAJ0844942.1 22166_t:CDS:2 [Entrophospora sp. SA101]
MSGFLSEMIKLPLFENTGNGTSLMCPGNNTTSSLKTYADFFSQVETFIPIAGLLFTIVIYGTKSIFGIMITCFLDDIVIITSSFGPIFWWYTFSKPFWFYGIINQLHDSNYNHNPIYSTVLNVLFGSMTIILFLGEIIRLYFHKCRNKLNEKSLWFQILPEKFRLTNKELFSALKALYIWIFNTIFVIILTRSIASFFSDNGVIECIYKHGEYEKVFAEIKVKNINEVVYFYKNDIKYRISSAKEYFYICEEDDDEGKNVDKKKNGVEEKNYVLIFLSVFFYFFFVIYELFKKLFEIISDNRVHFYQLEYKYDEEKQIEELKDKIFKKYFLKVKKYLFGQRVFECDPILKEIKKITKAKTKCSHFICEKLKKDMEKTTGTEIPGENRVKPKIKRIKVEWTGAEDKVRINILETGALNYFIYSHHKDSKDKCENKKENEENEQKEENEDICVDISEVASTSTSLTSAPSLSNLTLDSFYEVQSINLPKQKKAYNLRGGCKRKNAVWKYFNLKVKK